MKESTSKEKILKKIRNALMYPSINQYSKVDTEKAIYSPIEEPLDITFAKQLIKVKGEFIFCENQTEFIENFKLLIEQNNWSNIFCLDESIKKILKANNISYIDSERDFKKTNVGITYCEYLIARLGSVMISSKQASGRRLAVFPPVHIIIAFTSQLVPDIKDALNAIKTKYNSKLPSMISLITGPSRTADIEKTLIMGAHGPKELYVILIDDNTV